jgi:hypothetical protein
VTVPKQSVPGVRADLAVRQQVMPALELLHGAPRVPPEDAVNRQLQEVLQRPHERAVVAYVQQPYVLTVDPGCVRRCGGDHRDGHGSNAGQCAECPSSLVFHAD